MTTLLISTADGKRPRHLLQFCRLSLLLLILCRIVKNV